MNAFLALVKHPVKFRAFMLRNLPSAYFSGVRLQSIDEESCTVSVPYKWFSTNPFRSTYFACLAMAAEMSTGVLALAATYKSKPAVSMLVLNLEASFHKKATGVTLFTCSQGREIQAAVTQAKQTGAPKTLEAIAKGVNEKGELVAVFKITWTFKAKK